MANEKMKALVDEHRLAVKRLQDLQNEYIKVDINLKIANDVEKELNNEIQKAKVANDQGQAEYWQSVLDNCFKADKDWSNQKYLQELKDKVSGENEKLIAYYKKKIRMIERFLGDREVEIMGSYERKNIYMGAGQGSKAVIQDMDEEEENLAEQKRKSEGYNFDKM